MSLLPQVGLDDFPIPKFHLPRTTLQPVLHVKGDEQFPHSVLGLLFSPVGIEEEFKRGRISSLLGVEGGHGLGSSMGVVRALYDLGVRYITLTHKCHTPW